MGFKASEKMSKLDYDFSPYHPEVKGVTPEPSSAAVNHFTSRLAKAAEERGFAVKDPYDMREVSEVFGRMTEDDMRAIDTETREATAELCDGQPTHDEIMGLNHRPFQAWLGWLQGELSNPEASTGATVTSLGTRRVG